MRIKKDRITITKTGSFAGDYGIVVGGGVSGCAAQCRCTFVEKFKTL
jgi:hypothetical protein